jgi:hypothetical protein
MLLLFGEFAEQLQVTAMFFIAVFYLMFRLCGWLDDMSG